MLKRLCVLATFVASTVSAQEAPVVATVNYPLAWMAERLTGDAAQVFFPVPADRDPAFWRPGLSDIAAIQQADVIALNGAGFATWTARTSLPRSRLVDTSAAFSDAFIATQTVSHSHGADGAHSHTGTASYTWLDFAQAAQQAEALATAMQRRMPDLRAQISEALPVLLADLAALDRTARETFGALEGSTILATHPRYQYFARAYGLQITALDWEAGAMPDPAQWTKLEELATRSGASVLIWEATPPAEAMARAADIGLRSVVLSPLAGRPASGDFLSVMQAQLAELTGSQ